MDFANKNIVFIIPTFNRKEDVLNILSDIRNQKTKHTLFITLVIDGSSDGTEESVKDAYPDVDLVVGKDDWWYTKSMNMGFEATDLKDKDFLITMNDDCRINDDYVDSLVNSYYETGIQKSIMGSVSYSVENPDEIVFPGIKKIDWWRYKVTYYFPKGSKIDKNMEEVRPTQSLPGRGILIPVEVLNEVGFFDERFVQYYSDSEFVFRCISRGIPAFVSFKAKVNTYLSKTGQGSIHSKEPFIKFVRNFLNPYARNYIPNISRIIWMYGIKPLWIFTLLVKVLGHFKVYLLNKE